MRPQKKNYMQSIMLLGDASSAQLVHARAYARLATSRNSEQLQDSVSRGEEAWKRFDDAMEKYGDLERGKEEQKLLEELERRVAPYLAASNKTYRLAADGDYATAGTRPARALGGPSPWGIDPKGDVVLRPAPPPRPAASAARAGSWR